MFLINDFKKLTPLRCQTVWNNWLEMIALIITTWVFQSPPCFFSYDSICLQTSLCRLSSVPAGRWPFPTLSLQSLRRCLDPCPAVFSWCSCSHLPRKQRPHLRHHKFGTPNYPCNATSTGGTISGLQSFANVQAPRLRPPLKH